MASMQMAHRGQPQCGLLQARPAGGLAQQPRQAGAQLLAASPSSSAPAGRSLCGASTRVSRESRQPSVACEAVRVALLGAAGGIGQPLGLLLKMQPLIDELALYDIANVAGVAADLSHCNTRTQVSKSCARPWDSARALHAELLGRQSHGWLTAAGCGTQCCSSGRQGPAALRTPARTSSEQLHTQPASREGNARLSSLVGRSRATPARSICRTQLPARSW